MITRTRSHKTPKLNASLETAHWTAVAALVICIFNVGNDAHGFFITYMSIMGCIGNAIDFTEESLNYITHSEFRESNDHSRPAVSLLRSLLPLRVCD